MLPYSAPQPWHPEAVPFINHSLNHMAGKNDKGKQKEWNFTHKDKERMTAGKSSVVTKRLQGTRPRLPAAMYDVSV